MTDTLPKRLPLAVALLPLPAAKIKREVFEDTKETAVVISFVVPSEKDPCAVKLREAPVESETKPLGFRVSEVS